MLLPVIGAVVLIAVLAFGGFFLWNSDLNPLGKPVPVGRTPAAAPPLVTGKPTASALATPLLVAGKPTASVPVAPTAPVGGKATPSPVSSPEPGFGAAEYKNPDPARLVQSKTYGEVPVNQVLVMLKEGQSRQDGERVAAELGGAIVGEVEFISLYQIETRGTTEADLEASLAKARGLPGVALALTNARLSPKDLGCKACSPFTDPMYQQGDNGRPYEIIGVQGAWDIIRASGVKLSDVKVGVADDALYTKSDELGGRSRIAGIDKDDWTDQPEKDNMGNVVDGGLNHGTMVTQVIAADPDNGGVVGVAGALGEHLTVNVNNIYTAEPGYVESAPDPNDPTKAVWSNGKTYTVNTFSKIIKQVEAGATIINCSFGPTKPEPGNKDRSDAYKAFLEKMAKKYPKVLFVAAAGNENGGLDGSNYSIGGHKLPNLMTVGALDNKGNKASFSNHATGNGEVTLSAPGVDIPMGFEADGKTVIKSSGTSFAAPQVAAAAALIRSLNPDLTAEEIKKILVETAAPGVPGDKQSVPIPQGMGAGVLRVDQAVLKVINDTRAKQNPPLKPLDPKLFEQLVAIEGSAAAKKPGEYSVRATIGTIAASGSTEVSINLKGQGSISGLPRKQLSAPGDLTWDVALPDPTKGATVRLCRLDTSACCDIALPAGGILAGKWTGSSTLTHVDVTGMEALPPEAREQMNRAMGIGQTSTFAFTIVEETPESGKMIGSAGGQTYEYRYTFKNDELAITYTGTEMGAIFMTEGRAKVTVSGDTITLAGTWTGATRYGDMGVKATGTWKATKQKE